MKKIAVLFSGTGSNFAYLARHLPSKGVEIAVALTNNPDAGGIAVTREHGIPLEIVPSADYADREAFDAEMVARLIRHAPDLTVLAGFMRILTPVFTDRIRAINLHPSLLPRHKGLHAIRRSWEDPYPEGGVSVHWVTGELDGGTIILQRQVAKARLDFDAYDREVRRIEKEALVEAVLKSIYH
jgi:phosphoribosylglycinamide formyltransferase-1